MCNSTIYLTRNHNIYYACTYLYIYAFELCLAIMHIYIYMTLISRGTKEYATVDSTVSTWLDLISAVQHTHLLNPHVYISRFKIKY